MAEEACGLKWILEEDGSTHRHPFGRSSLEGDWGRGGIYSEGVTKDILSALPPPAPRSVASSQDNMDDDTTTKRSLHEPFVTSTSAVEQRPPPSPLPDIRRIGQRDETTREQTTEKIVVLARERSCLTKASSNTTATVSVLVL